MHQSNYSGGGPSGIEKWNVWQARPNAERAFHNVIIDLRRVDLQGAHLQHANLTETDLGGADLRNGDLQEADLHGISLARANLYDGSLVNASLNNSDLCGCNLGNVDFRGADLEYANLSGAYLDGSDFSQARFGGTVITSSLSRVTGLETVVHARPSDLSIHAITSLELNTHDDFLRGCGLNPRIYQLLMKGFEHPDDPKGVSGYHPLKLQSCFISYSTQDQVFVDRLRLALNDSGVDYWYAPEHGCWGQELTSQIEKQIVDRDRVLLVCSRASLSDSDWVRYELERALEEERVRGRRVVFPIMIDDALLAWKHPIASRIREVLAGDFREAITEKVFKERLWKLIEGLANAQ